MPHAPRLIRTALAVSLLVALSGCTSVGLGAPLASGGGGGDTAPGAQGGSGAITDAGQLTDDDGYIADGSSLTLDNDLPAVQRLNPALLDALRAADDAAEQRGTELTIADGWRSERYQAYLFAQAVEQYGSEEEASRWVKRGADSEHVSGDAVDIATADGVDFLNRFGAEWGLCQAYANEAWHFELLTEPGGECPAPAADGRG
ncbi:D-alanyl-D-alanine carboxypeptidase family protein [Leifsonia sp. F6_8S_P_1B]|uniref:D-alanyl-D-alanine carboxypeptidase family protein n=1 Tax=Leifsonia williamsii TaxID=3035919 RepID=A0ABT8K7E3_9MICO|nr:D-alanyl-D-alanine carboxypeptidase family protein [Leifsonia williamsii]MDN4612952.1 D-alanyl-D-alanine carboxypeptidase family protein [Leifsonia williamsii]